MSPIDSILYMVWRGLAVGVLISAPMGPVGMLCIQRTLDKGRRAGFYTGIGAAISDLIYCLLTGFGLSFIEDFLQENQNVIQLFGSVVLVAFSIYLFKKNPSSSMPRPVPQNVSAKKNILGGFLFTFSNPLIIFLIIGLFARFNFTAPEINGGFYAVGYLFIIVGALAWWYGVTYLIEKVRMKFSMRSMKKLNVIIGVVILAFACVGMVTSIIGLTSSEAKGGRFDPFGECAPHPLALQIEREAAEMENVVKAGRGIRIFNPGGKPCRLTLFAEGKTPVAGDCVKDSIMDFRLDFRLADNASHPGKRYSYTDSAGRVCKTRTPPWSVVATDVAGREWRLEFRPGEYAPDPLSSQSAVFATLILPDGERRARPVADGISAADGLNHFRLERNGGDLSLRAGNRGLREGILYDGDVSSPLKRLEIEVAPGGDVTLEEPMLRLPFAPGARRASMDMEEMARRLAASCDMTEGRWRMLDYSVEESAARLGGEYTVAIIRCPDSTYEIVYLEGANVGKSSWEPGMLKGRLTPSGHSGVYDLEWRDSNGRTIKGGLKAQREGDDLLTLLFPRLSASMRLKRL